MSPVVLTGDVTAPIVHAVTHTGCQRGNDEALQLPKGPTRTHSGIEGGERAHLPALDYRQVAA
jgi:hypothetical protein